MAAGGSVSNAIDCSTMAADLEPPFAVNTDGEYYATGWDGDHGDISAVDCPDRAPSAVGECQGFTYSGATAGWAGVVWQYPNNNWGTQPGKCIGDGATKLTFYAKATTDDVTLDFGAGDAGSLENVTLTTSWEKYEFDLSGYNSADLGGTITGFSWYTDAMKGIGTFYIDGIQWETADGGLGGASGD